MAKALASVPEMVIRGILPWCLTPELYNQKPEFIQQVEAFIRSRPSQPLPSFIEQSNAVLAHDAEAQLGRITAPTQITLGGRDLLTSMRFAEPMKAAIRNSELVVFERSAHAALYEDVAGFNEKTLQFLKRHAGRGGARTASTS